MRSAAEKSEGMDFAQQPEAGQAFYRHPAVLFAVGILAIGSLSFLRPQLGQTGAMDGSSAAAKIDSPSVSGSVSAVPSAPRHAPNSGGLAQQFSQQDPTSATLSLIWATDSGAPGIPLDRQIATPGSRLNNPPRLQVIDANRRPASGVRVYYLLIPEEKSSSRQNEVLSAVPPSPLITDSKGIAELLQVRVNTLGKHRIEFFLNPEAPDSGPRLTFQIECRTKSWFNWMLVGLTGGMALFLLGAKLTGDGLGRLGGPRLRDWMGRLDSHPVLGVFVGALSTFLVQSSTASTTMFVSFAGVNTMTLRQAMPLIFGSAIGTTLIVQLLAFNVYDVALIAVALGVLLQLPARSSRAVRDLGAGLFGFGLIFHGMQLMIQAMMPLRSLPWLAGALYALQDYPGWTIILAAILTAMIHSSAAVLGLVLALAHQNLITPLAAVPMVFGANIGTTTSALLAAAGMGREARRVALANVLFKVIGVLVFLPLIPFLAWAGVKVTVLFTGGGDPLTANQMTRAIANTHTIFNLMISFMALPFMTQYEKLLRRIIPARGEEGAESGFKYLDLPVQESPRLVHGAVLREISRMGRFVEEQMKATRQALFEADERQLDYVARRDDKIDSLHRNLTRYLTSMMGQQGVQAEAERFLDLIQIVNNIEHIGDLLDKNIAPLAKKRIVYGTKFSEEGERELKDMFLQVASDLSTLFVALPSMDSETLKTVRKHREALESVGRKILVSHLNRLQAGSRESRESSSIHVDLVNYLLRVEFHIYHIAGIALADIRRTANLAENGTNGSAAANP